MMKLGGEAEGMPEAAVETAPPPAAPRAVGAAVPEPPHDHEAALNRQQRRARERLQRKQCREETK